MWVKPPERSQRPGKRRQLLMMAVGLASRTAVKPVLDFSDMVILA
jgi:hypothetical protein